MKYCVGIDISKGKSTVSILSEHGEVIEMPFEINHDNDGLNHLKEILNKYPKESLKIVMEETGTYHLPVLNYLLDNDFFVCADNVFKIKKNLDHDIRKVKNDNKDSLKIAEYCCNNWYRIKKYCQTDEKYAQLKFLSRQYTAQMSVQTKEKVQLSNLCDLLFPGFYSLLDENNFILGITVFKKYCHPKLVLKKKKTSFINEVDKIAKKLGHRSAGITLANKIYELANKTVSPYPYNEYSQLSVDCCVDLLILTINTTSNIITKMEELASTLPEYDTVRNMEGCGAKLTPRIIAEIGDIRRFKNAGSIIAYGGLDAPPYQSGQFEATIRHISKRGNKYLRKAGYEIMKSIKSSGKAGNELYDYISKKEEEGKAKKVAKIAGLNKFIRIYYGKVREKYRELEIW